MKTLLLLMIRLYQKTLSYDHGIMGRIFPNTRFCRYTPSCSEYGYVVIERFGVIKGGPMAIRRVMRCNAWSKHPHWDPPPER